jgi:regulator of RNase E activity RraA
VRPNSLVFGDRDGIVVIPPAAEEATLARAREVLATEKGILNDIATGVDIDTILQRHGFF